MSRCIFNLTLAFSLLFIALSAQASSCDPAMKADVQKVSYEESNCAKKALETSDNLVKEAAKAEQLGESDHMCGDLYSALIQLDKYKAGDWRAEFKYISSKVDAGYADVLDKIMKANCRQKIDLYRHLAEEGDAWGMYNLGNSYLKGIGVPQSDADALAWYQKAAEKKYTSAYLALGTLYSDGAAFQEDYATAFDWFMQAAAQGDASAQFTVANMFRKGVGVKQNLAQAAEWYKKSAEQKHQGAKAKLEEMYKAGEAKKPSSFW